MSSPRRSQTGACFACCACGADVALLQKLREALRCEASAVIGAYFARRSELSGPPLDCLDYLAGLIDLDGPRCAAPGSAPTLGESAVFPAAVLIQKTSM